jgi:hypothetical protein
MFVFNIKKPLLRTVLLLLAACYVALSFWVFNSKFQPSRQNNRDGEREAPIILAAFLKHSLAQHM